MSVTPSGAHSCIPYELNFLRTRYHGHPGYPAEYARTILENHAQWSLGLYVNILRQVSGWLPLLTPPLRALGHYEAAQGSLLPASLAAVTPWLRWRWFLLCDTSRPLSVTFSLKPIFLFCADS